MIAVRPRRNAEDPGWILPMAQETKHTQENPSQLHIVCPILKKFPVRKQIVEGIGNSGMTPWRPLVEF